LKRLKNDNSQLQILGDGTQSKSYIYITDILDAIELILNSINTDIYFDIYNVATTDYVSVTEIAKISCKTIGKDFNEVNFKYSGGDRGWNGDVPRVLFNTEKIRNLGWSNKLNSYDAIKQSLSDMNSNNKK